MAKMLDLEGRDIHQCSDGYSNDKHKNIYESYSVLWSGCRSWLPVYTDPSQQLGVMSIAFLLSHRDDAIVWRGPKKNGICSCCHFYAVGSHFNVLIHSDDQTISQ